MLTNRLILMLIFCLTFLPAVGPAQADKPKPKLLDGELIEEGQPSSGPGPNSTGPGKPHQPNRYSAERVQRHPPCQSIHRLWLESSHL